MKNANETEKNGKKLAVINPFKFGYDSEKLAGFVELLRNELAVDCVLTMSKEHLAETVRNSGAYDVVIAVGGDGTINEVINNMNIEKQDLAIIPMGTGNGFALELKISSVAQAIEKIKLGMTEKIDLIDVYYEENGVEKHRYCVSTSGMGYVAEVVKLAEKKYKGLRKLCYPVCSVITALFNSFRLALSNGREVYTNVVVNNTVYAGNFGACVSALHNDGFMDVVLGNAGPLQQILYNISLLTKAFHYRPCREFQTNYLNFNLEKSTALMIDGEITENANNIRFIAMKKAFECVA